MMVYHIKREERCIYMRDTEQTNPSQRIGANGSPSSGSTPGPHSLWIAGREEITVRGVAEVQSFDENSVCLITTRGGLTLEGRDLRVTALDTEGGVLSVSGLLCGAFYTDEGTDETTQNGNGSRRRRFSHLFR